MNFFFEHFPLHEFFFGHFPLQEFFFGFFPTPLPHHFSNGPSLTPRGVILARYDVILNQSGRALLYNHLSNYTNLVVDADRLT